MGYMSSIMKARIAYTGSALENGEMGIRNFTNALLAFVDLVQHAIKQWAENWESGAAKYIFYWKNWINRVIQINGFYVYLFFVGGSYEKRVRHGKWFLHNILRHILFIKIKAS